MKILLLSTLATALLSFNSFADTNSDIQDIASMIAKDGLQQMNSQLTINLQNDIQSSLSVTGMNMNSKTPILLAKLTSKSQQPAKSTAQAADE